MAKKKYATILLILILLSLVIFSFFRAYVQYNNWKENRNYFEGKNPQIESWMTIQMISERFNLSTTDILSNMEVSGAPVNKHLTLDRYCMQYHKDCAELTQRLNQLIKR